MCFPEKSRENWINILWYFALKGLLWGRQLLHHRKWIFFLAFLLLASGLRFPCSRWFIIDHFVWTILTPFKYCPIAHTLPAKLPSFTEAVKYRNLALLLHSRNLGWTAASCATHQQSCMWSKCRCYKTSPRSFSLSILLNVRHTKAMVFTDASSQETWMLSGSLTEWSLTPRSLFPPRKSALLHPFRS